MKIKYCLADFSTTHFDKFILDIALIKEKLLSGKVISASFIL